MKRRVKRTLLDDFIKIYQSINCSSLYCRCNECSNKKICDIVYKALTSIAKFY